MEQLSTLYIINVCAINMCVQRPLSESIVLLLCAARGSRAMAKGHSCVLFIIPGVLQIPTRILQSQKGI